MIRCRICDKEISNEQYAKYFETCPDCYPKIKRNTVRSGIAMAIIFTILATIVIFGISYVESIVGDILGPDAIRSGLVIIVIIFCLVFYAGAALAAGVAIKWGKQLHNPEYIDKNWEKKLKQISA